MKTYEELEAACTQLKKTERGQRALKALSQFASTGGLSLDERNKRACTELFTACLTNPWDLPAWFTSAEEVTR